MPTSTTNYGLIKPALNETADIVVVNQNMEIIDTELKNANDNAAGRISKSLATAASQFLLSSAAGQWVVKTVAEIKTLLGLGSAAYKDFNAAGGVAAYDTVNTHIGDYVRQPGAGTTTGNANSYALTLNPAPASYADEMGIVLKINVDSTAASTINVNGLGAKALKKANGNDVTNLKTNGIYTFRYNATSGNFILQGEGGEYGNVTASDVKKGVTFGAENGVLIGTLLTPPSWVKSIWAAITAYPSGYGYGFGGAAVGMLDDGKIYIVGGGNPTNKNACYDPLTNTWTMKTDFPGGFDGAMGCPHKSIMLGVISGMGGGTDPVVSSTMYHYDRLTNTWTNKGALPSGRYNGRMISDGNNLIYIIGGDQSRLSLNATTHVYDMTLGTYSTKAATPSATQGEGIGLIINNGIIYTIGGKNSAYGYSSGNTTTVYAFDITLNTWTSKAVTPAATSSITGGMMSDGKIHAFTGGTHLLYDILGNTWSTDSTGTNGVSLGQAVIDNNHNNWAYQMASGTQGIYIQL